MNRCCGDLAQDTAQINRNGLASGLYDDAGTVGYETQDSYTLVVEVTDGIEIDTATITINVDDVNEVPVILTFEVIDGWGDFWTFEGTIQDEDCANLTIVFGGVLDGHSTTSFADGSFMYTIEMSSTEIYGPVSAKVIDSSGLVSEIEWRWVQG